ncbi:ABC transporter permease [Acrocarpospora macrocephala]|uniref:Peptide ABC transporter permease n=1 Tax=Acrocarpospora macrocephala TaxID=150177 RepID=A0A5M3WLV0_9ACTN|nr:ABC transporter permease [Acrocarpospora macrocephala]GES09012.1 peptide ABC transporter permease [Acrocarpospora macrocephala]
MPRTEPISAITPPAAGATTAPPGPAAETRPRGAGFDVLTLMCGLWLLTLAVVALVAPLLPLGEHQDSALTLAEPIYAPPDLASAHPLGTNALGLDLLARVIYGARISLVVCISAVLIGMAVGGIVGITAGYLRGKVDVVIGVLTNSLLAVPTLIMLIALASVLRPTPQNMVIALSLVAVPGMIRVARAQTLALSQREYVTVARALGARRSRVILRELLPNVALAIIPLGMIYISALIVAEASLSFLGIGIRPPQPTWGNMIAEGQDGKMEQYPFLVIVPAFFLFLTVFSFNLIGERLRKVWDTRQVKL